VKLVLTLWGMAAVLLVLQGAFATFVSPFWCPDFALLLVLCIGMQWEGFASGSALAAGLGFAADLLAGSFAGQHALLFLLVFAVGQLAARQLNLRSALSLMTAGGAVVLAGGLFLISLSSVGEPGSAAEWFWRPELLPRASVSALVTPGIFRVVQRLAARLTDEDTGPRAQRLARPGRVA
jgi:rod shape-determining protein MreD